MDWWLCGSCMVVKEQMFCKEPKIIIFVFLYLILYVPSTIFQLNRDGSSWVGPELSKDKYVLLKDHDAVTPVIIIFVEKYHFNSNYWLIK